MKKSHLYLAVLLAFAGMSSDADAYTVESYWSSPFTMARDLCSISNNSPSHWAYGNSGSKLWSVANQMNWNYAYNAGCSISANNGINQTARVARSAISGSNGMTTRIYNSSGDIKEADVKIADDIYLGPDDESWFYGPPNSGSATTMLHEHTHALGLGHTQSINMMRTSAPQPMAGGSTHLLFPDDRSGVRSLYNGTPSYLNLFVSAQRLAWGNSIVQNDTPQTQSACRGGSVTLTYTVMNASNSFVSNAAFRIFISNASANDYSGGINLFSGSATMNYNNGFTETRTLIIPYGTPPGTYWTFWQVDGNNVLPETHEEDNAVHGPVLVQVLSCII